MQPDYEFEFDWASGENYEVVVTAIIDEKRVRVHVVSDPEIKEDRDVEDLYVIRPLDETITNKK